MELRELIETCETAVATAADDYQNNLENEAKAQLQRMATLITDELKPPEKPAEETDQAQKQDGAASS